VVSYMKIFLKSPARFLPKSYGWFTKCGWLPVKFHYYQPIIKKDMLPTNYENIEDPLIGIDLNIESQLQLLEKFNYSSELEKISVHAKNFLKPDFHNLNFGPGDSEILYSMIRYFKPRKVIEIGSGESTKFVKAGLDENEKETGYKAEQICIEPFEQPWLEKSGMKIIRKKVEEVDLSLFSKLSENDILFIDSSHVIRTKGDVVWEYLKIIPSLKKGVIIHCHDIFLPKDYPLSWIETRKWFWNEQYLLQALLSHSSRYMVLLALNFLNKKHGKKLRNCCPILKKEDGDPASFWFKIN